ncbi:hypothetical protein GUJ93_ZPchr0006g44360 [Zizania palustris]|uniref:Uncharacterized protein n=1 Tax=Zizania palustris TaxID=103762 RepID=A0A8J5S8E2_ZIZPA|nr:hypothetical protein GUJ93_ZPchr0006g44360 [Zizania palustris]
MAQQSRQRRAVIAGHGVGGEAIGHWDGGAGDKTVGGWQTHAVGVAVWEVRRLAQEASSRQWYGRRGDKCGRCGSRRAADAG